MMSSTWTASSSNSRLTFTMPASVWAVSVTTSKEISVVVIGAASARQVAAMSLVCRGSFSVS